MQHTKKSLLLLAGLVGLVLFFTGLNLGKSIERLDKSYIPPTPVKASPTPLLQPSPKAITYTRFEFKECEVSFLIPSHLTQRTTSSDESEFTGKDSNEHIFASCNDTFIADQETLFPQALASTSAQLINQKTTIYTLKNEHIWVVRNQNRQKVLFATTPSLSPLVQQTLELK